VEQAIVLRPNLRDRQARRVGHDPVAIEPGEPSGFRSRTRSGSASTSAPVTSTASTVSPATAAVSPAEPASPAPAFAGTTVVFAVVVIVAVARVAAVVTAARGAASCGSSTATSAARVEEDAYDNDDHDYGCDCQERPHDDPPRAGFPDVTFSLAVSASALQQRMRGDESDRRDVDPNTNVRAPGPYTRRDTQRVYSQRCDEWIERRSW
jgi:hypothetical protein